MTAATTTAVVVIRVDVAAVAMVVACGGGLNVGVERRMWCPRGGSVSRWELQRCYAVLVAVRLRK